MEKGLENQVVKSFDFGKEKKSNGEFKQESEFVKTIDRKSVV